MDTELLLIQVLKNQSAILLMLGEIFDVTVSDQHFTGEPAGLFVDPKDGLKTLAEDMLVLTTDMIVKAEGE